MQSRQMCGQIMFVLTAFYLLCIIDSVAAIDLTAIPPPNPLKPLTLVEEHGHSVELLFSNCSGKRNITISISEGTERTLSYPSHVYNIPCNDTFDTNGTGVSADLFAKAIGFITLSINDDKTEEKYMDYPIGVIRPEKQVKDSIFLYGIIGLSIFNTFCFGIKLDLEKVKNYLKKPVAPAIGLVCQFIFMPLIAFTLTQIIQKHPSQELGVFTAGVAPGGGASNVWTFALGGDIDLSITMTFLSSFAAIGFIPLWMYTLGQYIIDQASDEGGDKMTLPFEQMALTLTYIIVPVIIGLLVNRYLPKVVKVVLLFQKVMIAITIAFAIGMGTYANIYAFKLVLFDYQLLLAAMCLPWLGFLFGFLVGLVTMKEKAVALTIGIETAVQNTSIATILLRTSLKQPWADISTAVPIVLHLFVPIPFYFLLAGRIFYLKVYKKSKTTPEKEEEEGEDNPTFASDEKDNSPEENKEKLTEL